MLTRMQWYQASVRWARESWWKYRPRPEIEPSDEELLAQLLDIIGEDEEAR